MNVTIESVNLERRATRDIPIHLLPYYIFIRSHF